MADNNFIEQRSKKPSLLMRLGTWLISKQPEIFPRTHEGVARYLEQRELPPDTPMPEKFNRRFNVEYWQAAGHDCLTLHPKAGKGAKHILYFHGGGFVLPMLKPHWPLVAAMVEETAASLTVPMYPLAPESSRKQQDKVADAAWANLTRQWSPSEIILSGDSAGGHMALALALRQIRAGGALPGKLALFAPWLDVTMADDAAREVEPHDVILRVEALRAMGAAWAGDDEAGGPECSPLYAAEEELAQLPPTQMFVGQHDMFVIDNRTFARRLGAAGGSVKLYEYAGAPHVFMAVLNTREAKDCLRLVGEFVTA
ncbi:MAG TPA: alpha/beta hydrolase [Erythrobacter sp.]|nr:alpha/beta hydrolase [Erythrobacter sp.]